MSPSTITLLFLAFAIVSFVLEKIPLGLTATIVAVGLNLTGVLDNSQTFAGYDSLVYDFHNIQIPCIRGNLLCPFYFIRCKSIGRINLMLKIHIIIQCNPFFKTLTVIIMFTHMNIVFSLDGNNNYIIFIFHKTMFYCSMCLSGKYHSCSCKCNVCSRNMFLKLCFDLFSIQSINIDQILIIHHFLKPGIFRIKFSIDITQLFCLEFFLFFSCFFQLPQISFFKSISFSLYTYCQNLYSPNCHDLPQILIGFIKSCSIFCKNDY